MKAVNLAVRQLPGRPRAKLKVAKMGPGKLLDLCGSLRAGCEHAAESGWFLYIYVRGLIWPDSPFEMHEWVSVARGLEACTVRVFLNILYRVHSAIVHVGTFRCLRLLRVLRLGMNEYQ